jgi:hypothetical protein
MPTTPHLLDVVALLTDVLAHSLCFANIPTAVRITTETCASRPKRRCFRPSDFDDLNAQRGTQNCRSSPRANSLQTVHWPQGSDVGTG